MRNTIRLLRAAALFGFAAVASLATVTAAQQSRPTPAAPEVHVAALQTVSAHVQVIPDGSVMMVPNVGFVVGDRAVLVVDTGLGLHNGAIIAAAAQRVAPGKQIYIVITHAHPEHDLGAAAFPSTSTLIRSRQQQADLAEYLPESNRSISAYSPVFAERIGGAPIRDADIIFDDEYILDLGGVTARIFAAGPNHTPGDTAIWIADDRVLFAGDLAMTAQPVFAAPGATIAHWLQTLDTLEQLQPAIIVPSHGPLGDVGLIHGYRAHLTELRDRTWAARARGLDLDAAIAEVTAAMLQRYPDAGRISRAVRVAYVEAAP